MPKGRRANPSTARDGVWFQHTKLLPIYPESLTASEQKQILNLETVRQIENRLPLMYKLREKKPVNTFPFSVHDNRDCLLNVGGHLDSGLGRKKFKRETCQHYGQNFSFLAHEPILSSTSCRTVYQTSFVPYPNIEQPFPGRFPKSHVERSKALNPASKNDCTWLSEYYTGRKKLIPDDPVTSAATLFVLVAYPGRKGTGGCLQAATPPGTPTERWHGPLRWLDASRMPVLVSLGSAATAAPGDRHPGLPANVWAALHSASSLDVAGGTSLSCRPKGKRQRVLGPSLLAHGSQPVTLSELAQWIQEQLRRTLLPFPDGIWFTVAAELQYMKTI
uniref:testis-expressed protein 36 n=1 Tax=Euleptes europaea TaxID=460621 RepID=UPI0025413717|nr:testis-expressed protein 36 [Euleptes europaea]